MGGINGRSLCSQRHVESGYWNSADFPSPDVIMGRGRVDSSTSSTALFSSRRRTMSSADAIELVEEQPNGDAARMNEKGLEKSISYNEKNDNLNEPDSSVVTSDNSRPTRASTFTKYSAWAQENQREVVRKANLFFKEYVLHGVFRQRPLPPSKDGRHIELDASRTSPLVDERRDHPYIDNHIRSSRYTIWSFIPSQLWFQFTKVANFYFLVTGVIQLIPGLSTTGSFTTIAPLLVFLCFSIFREGYDDFRRYRLDKKENRRPARVLAGFRAGSLENECCSPLKARLKAYLSKLKFGNLRRDRRPAEAAPTTPYEKDFSATTTTVNSEDPESTHWITEKWINLRVGDIIEVRRDDQVPADIVLLSAEGRNGIAYIETMALDGETNLKSRQPPTILAERCKNLTDISTCRAQFVVEDPNLDLYAFNGKVSVDGKTVPLTLTNVVYRGSVLRNTTRAIGMIINTGEECKIRMNANKNPQAKAPAIQSMTNHVVIYLAALVILLAIGCSAGYVIWSKVYERKAWYLTNSHIKFADIFVAFAIMYNNLIPLALYVSLEIVKFCQFLLLQDIEMYDEASNTPMVSNTQTIFENLGQISYIFSDKTGTLTENVMRFRKMSVAGAIWTHNADDNGGNSGTIVGGDVSEALRSDKKKAADVEVSAVSPPAEDEPLFDGSHLSSKSLNNDDWKFSNGLTNNIRETSELQQHLLSRPNSKYSDSIKIFLLSLALCHTCFPETQQDGNIAYQAASPDEHALVEAAHELGYSLLARDSHFITLQVPSVDEGQTQQEVYEILDVIEFSTHRKRMSIIVSFPDGRICLFCKGADSIMKPRFKQEPQATHKTQIFDEISEVGTNDIGPAVFSICHQHINSFASEGLRTLVYGHRFIPKSEYANWSSIYQAATTSLNKRQTMIEAAGELIEVDLTLGGATAIEDKLQKGVPETIKKLQQAHIKIWMLTGDKRETAINIAHSAHICNPDSNFIILNIENPVPLEIQISSAVTELQNAPPSHFVIVIDGQTLTSVETNNSFFSILLLASSVIVCRASPAQKASIVRSIRHLQPDKLTLAIGDGGNDIAMITEAHVGIGISGKEGLQAARVADYSIAQFRFLQRLLLVHGHWNYIRTAKFILYTFWKEMLFYSIQCLYQRWNGYTGTSLFESDGLTVWNTLFSSLCVIIPGIFEQDLSSQTLLSQPYLYRTGQESNEFNMKSYAYWMGIAAVEAVVIYFACYGLYGCVMMRGDEGLYAFGDLLFSVAVVFINGKLLFMIYHHLTWVPLTALGITVGGWWAWNFFLSGIYSRTPGPYYVRDAFTYHFGADLLWWAVLVIVVLMVSVFDLTIEVVRRRWWPTEVDIWQEREIEMKKRHLMKG